jgi:hypothetical protein
VEKDRVESKELAMHWSDFPFRPPLTTLRWFAAIWVALLAAWAFYARDSVSAAGILVGLAVAFGLLGVGLPTTLRPLFITMMVVTYPIGWLVSRVLLVLVFCCLFIPLALLFKLIGRDALGRRWESDRKSYWMPKVTGDEPRSYLRQS